MPVDPYDLSAAVGHHRAGRRAEAEAVCRRVLERDPNDAAALQLLGVMAQSQGRTAVAMKLMRLAVAAPAGAEYHNSLGAVLADAGRREEAVDAFRRAVGLSPGYGEGWRNLAVTLAKGGRLREALDAGRRATEVSPDDPGVWEAASALCHEADDLPGMLAAGRALVRLRPGRADLHSDLLYALHFDPGASPAQLLAEHTAWAARHAEPLRREWRPHDNDRDPDGASASGTCRPASGPPHRPVPGRRRSAARDRGHRRDHLLR